jgi:hypothetical protein
LIIKPSETLLTRDQYKSFIALCTDQSNNQVIGWRSPQQRDIPENENDRYKICYKKKKEFKVFSFSVTIERQKNGIRLRIRNLTTEDQGII